MRIGDKFSTEHQLCDEFGVSRMTINRVIKTLEAQNYLKRVQGSGTYIDRPAGDKPIIFLLPCPEYMLYDCTYPLRLVLYGAERQAADLGREVKGIWVSPSNSPDDIDFNKLQSIDEGTDVIIYSEWFKNTFEFIKKHCRKTVFISPNSNRVSPNVPESWLTLSNDPVNGLRKAVNYLASINRKNVVFAHTYKENNHFMKTAFEKTMRENNLLITPKQFCQFESADSLERGFSRLLSQTNQPIDAVLMSNPNNTSMLLRLLRDYGLKVPEDVAVLTLGDNKWLLDQQPPVSAIGAPYVRFGRKAVENIATPDMNSGNMVFNMELTIRESTQKGAGAPISPHCFPVDNSLERFND